MFVSEICSEFLTYKQISDQFHNYKLLLIQIAGDNSEVLLQTLIGRKHKLSLYMCRNSVKKVCDGKKLDIEKNDAPNY